MTKYFFPVIAFYFILPSQAVIFEAWDFSAIDGDVQNNVALFESAKAIQESAGAHAEYWQQDVNGENVISYVVRFPDLSSRVKWKDEMLCNEEWLEWVSKEWPKARPHLVTSYAMNYLLEPTAAVDLQKDLASLTCQPWSPVRTPNL